MGKAKPTWRECAEALKAVSSGARFEDTNKDVAYSLIGASLISREEQHKACPTCGTPRIDFAFWKITAAGRMLIQAFVEQEPRP